jgi:hypothetical protein
MFPFGTLQAETQRFFEFTFDFGDGPAQAVPFDIGMPAHQKTERSV